MIATRMEHKAAFRAVGLQILWKPEQVKPSENQLSKLWERFTPQKWFPDSKTYEAAGDWNFEYYDKRFLGNANPESVYEVWFPVRAKQV